MYTFDIVRLFLCISIMRYIHFFKTFFKKGQNILILSFSFLLFLGIYLFYSLKPDFVIFPHNNQFHFSTYTDKDIGGNSEITYFEVSDSVIVLDYILKDSAFVYYVGMSSYSHDWNYFDISGYNQLKISIESIGIEEIGLYIFTPNTFNDKIENICFFENITYTPHQLTYIIDLKKFKIPNWWFDISKLSQHEKINIDLKQIHFFNIGNAYTTDVLHQNSLRIYHIAFSRDNTKLLFTLCMLLLGIFGVLIIIHYLKNYRPLKKNSVIIEYKAVNIEEDTKRLYYFIDYINMHFDDEDLSLEKVAAQTGINHRRITQYIHDTYSCNFKTYVNRIRIHESKNLLKKSELSIGEIAFKVGFNNQSYFNRIFKSIEGVSPTVFRNNNPR